MSNTDIRIELYNQDFMAQWEDFIDKSFNGCFIHKRKFLNYHSPEKFKDHSLIFYKGNAIVAVMPACEISLNDRKTFFSHRGSTFGGFVFSEKFFEIQIINKIIESFNQYVNPLNFDQIILKQQSNIFSKGSTDNLKYLLGINSFKHYEELSFVIDLKGLTENNLIDSFRPNTRSKVRQSMKNDLHCEYVESDESITKFHEILSSNLEKHESKPIHSVNELIDLKKRFPTEIEFIHCKKGNDVIAASMTWNFNNKVIHTQNISIDYRYSDLKPSNFMIHFMINQAMKKSFNYFSFGISTENQGKELNFGLAEFKEGFGANGHLNYTHYRSL